MQVFPAIVLVGLMALVGGCGKGEEKKAETEAPKPAAPAVPSEPVVGTGGGRPQIGMIALGERAAYWQLVHGGAEKALAEGKKTPEGKPVIDVLWIAPEKPGMQVELAKELLRKGVGAIVVAPEDESSLTGIVASAGRVPVVAMDTELKVSGVKSVIGTGKAVSKEEVQKLRAGEIQSVSVADPAAVGMLAVKTASDCMKEKKVEALIEAPQMAVTQENLDSVEKAGLLNTPVEK